MVDVPPLPPGFQLETAAQPPPLPPGFQLEQPQAPGIVADVAKSGGIGLAKGGIGLAGMAGDVGAIADKATEWLAGKIGADPALAVKAQRMARPDILNAPSSAQIQKGIESQTGQFYQPKTTAGEYAQTVGEFAPAAIGGPETIGSRLLTRVLVPAVASETAGQMTKGTAAEPTARVVAALGAGGLSALRRTPQAEAPSLADIQAARDADYAAVQNMGVTVTPAALNREATAATANLASIGLTEDVAPKTVAVLEKLGNRPTAASITDIDNARKVLGNIAKGSTSPSSMERIDAAAARFAIDHIDDALPKLSPTDLASGAARHADAIEALTNARGNAAAAFRAQDLDRTAYRASLNAAAANSGMNVENSLRQQLKSILTNPARARGFSADEISTMESIVRGERLRNVIRTAGNVLGGGGGLGALAAGAAGHAVMPGAGILTPVLGRGLKMAGNAATNRAFNRLDEMVRRRSPLGQAAPVPPPVPRISPFRAALINAALARPTLSPDRVPVPAY